jgi:hypothetical protein
MEDSDREGYGNVTGCGDGEASMVGLLGLME